MHAKSPHASLYLRALSSAELWRRAAPFGFAVGFCQSALNQGDHWLHLNFSTAVIFKTILSPLVGLAVALHSAAITSARFQRLRADQS